jgi:Zn finger protein HypA/HybF involved in hydrogenase expression
MLTDRQKETTVQNILTKYHELYRPYIYDQELADVAYAKMAMNEGNRKSTAFQNGLATLQLLITMSSFSCSECGADITREEHEKGGWCNTCQVKD